ALAAGQLAELPLDDFDPVPLTEADLDQLLAGLLVDPQEVAAAEAAKPARAGKILEKQRHKTLISYAGYLRRGGFDETKIRAAISAINQEDFVPPLPESEVAEI